MNIQILIENTAEGSLACEHGLSIYIETETKRFLMDTGKSGQFAENADRLGVDLERVDAVILSHGHYDHGGGLPTFLKRNGNAPVYAHRSAFGAYYSDHGDSMDYIGLDQGLLNSPQLRLLDGDMGICEEAYIFSGVPHDILWLRSNCTLYEKSGKEYHLDEFCHEQNLLITEGKRQVLICGCAHNGIVNILKKSRSITGRWPDAVIGGFHLMNPSRKEEADRELVEGTAKFLEGLRAPGGDTRYYTGHCTGDAAYGILRERLGNRVEALHSGKKVRIS